jgi:hypothetical protein
MQVKGMLSRNPAKKKPSKTLQLGHKKQNKTKKKTNQTQTNKQKQNLNLHCLLFLENIELVHLVPPN